MKRVAICCPVYKRPETTIKAIECVLNQTINGWQAFFVGDGCQIFRENLLSGKFSEYSELAKKNGNEMYFIDLQDHSGGWGYAARNAVFKLANAKYICFLDNDDEIRPNHLENYLSAIENTDLDMVFFNTEVSGGIRDSRLSFGYIGHSEIILKTEHLKKYQQPPTYGHDWHLIETMLRKKLKIKKSKNPPTYIVTGIGQKLN